MWLGHRLLLDAYLLAAANKIEHRRHIAEHVAEVPFYAQPACEHRLQRIQLSLEDFHELLALRSQHEGCLGQAVDLLIDHGCMPANTMPEIHIEESGSHFYRVFVWVD